MNTDEDEYTPAERFRIRMTDDHQIFDTGFKTHITQAVAWLNSYNGTRPFVVEERYDKRVSEWRKVDINEH